MAMSILKLLLVTVIVVVLTIFAVQNMKPVTLNLILSEPAELNLIFLLLISFILGGISLFFFMMLAKLQKRWKEKV